MIDLSFRFEVVLGCFLLFILYLLAFTNIKFIGSRVFHHELSFFIRLISPFLRFPFSFTIFFALISASFN